MTPKKVYVDVENTLAVPFLSGIQRIVKELLVRFATQPIEEIVVIPVVHCEFCRGWRQLSASERHVLYRFRSSNSAAWDANGWLRRTAKIALGKRGLAILWKRWLWYQHARHHRAQRLPRFESGTVFLDLEASWHNPLARDSLLPALKRSGVHVVTFHYDIIPQLFPEMTHHNTVRIFEPHLHAHLMHSDLFVCISSQVEQDLKNYAFSRNATRTPNTVVIQLGSDIFRTDDSDIKCPLPEGLSQFILCVGTLEPRKNPGALLDAFDTVSSYHPDLTLVVVGRVGWDANQVVKRIKDHPLYGKRLIWLQGIDNDALDWLYKSAYLNVVPSSYEGFGLPVIEGLRRGCVTLASNSGALPEAGRDFVEYFDLSDSDNLASMLREYLENPGKYNDRRIQLQSYVPRSWDESAQNLLNLLRNVNGNSGSSTR